jgi:hypothetical protein
MKRLCSRFVLSIAFPACAGGMVGCSKQEPTSSAATQSAEDLARIRAMMGEERAKKLKAEQDDAEASRKLREAAAAPRLDLKY